jgi:hypothetical protein
MNVIISNQSQELLAGLQIDVIKSMNGEFDAEEIISTFSNFFYNKMILDITAIRNYKDTKNIQKLSVALDMSKIIILLDGADESSSAAYLSKLISMGIYNFTKNVEGIMYLYNHPNSYKDVVHLQQLDELTTTIAAKVDEGNMRMLGIRNVTDHAGATTLIYMLKKQLEKNYSVVAVEVNKRDFVYFNDKNMLSITTEGFPREVLKLKDTNIILVDLNDVSEEDDDACNDILYLIEPSSIKLNRLMKKDRRIFEKLRGKKVVLNKSLLDSKDVMDFEYESKSQVYYNVPPLNERGSNHSLLDSLLSKLGFLKQKVDEKDEKNKILGLFKF